MKGQGGVIRISDSPGFEYECTAVYINSAEEVKENSRCEGSGLVAHHSSG